MQLITITSQDYTIEAMRIEYAEDPSLSNAEITALADAEYAYLINHTGEALRGWSYTGAGFTGPSRSDAIMGIMELMVAAVDHALGALVLIRLELAQEQARG
jgi:hypothetical protein